jgi:hypothetical protein
MENCRDHGDAGRDRCWSASFPIVASRTRSNGQARFLSCSRGAADSREIDRGVVIRESKQRQRKRLLYRRRAGRDSGSLGPFSTEILARIEARLGEPDRAVTALNELFSTPYRGPLVWVRPITPALLQLDPMFDPLRSDPRFQKLVATKAVATPENSKR